MQMKGDATQTTIFVAARELDDGYSLPFVAFHTKAEALAWRGSQEFRFAITEVPISPDLPQHDYWDQKEL